jgi:hypothetical protein
MMFVKLVMLCCEMLGIYLHNFGLFFAKIALGPRLGLMFFCKVLTHCPRIEINLCEKILANY